MPQIQLPVVPEGVTPITLLPAYSKHDGRVTYFKGSMPVFVHDDEDVANSLRKHLKRPDEARRLLRALYSNEADLLDVTDIYRDFF